MLEIALRGDGIIAMCGQWSPLSVRSEIKLICSSSSIDGDGDDDLGRSGIS